MKQTVKSWHEEHAKIWDSLMYANSITAKVREDEKKSVLRMVTPVKGLKVLDIGTGTGRFAVEYLKDGAVWLTGIDVAKNMMEEAKKKCEPFKRKCAFKQMSVHSLRFPKSSFDFVSCIGVIEHCGGEKRAIQQMSRVLRPGGKIVIASANGDYLMKGLVRTYEKRVTGLPKFFHTDADFEKWFEDCGIRLEDVDYCGLSKVRPFAMRIVVKGTKVK